MRGGVHGMLALGIGAMLAVTACGSDDGGGKSSSGGAGGSFGGVELSGQNIQRARCPAALVVP